MSVDEGKRIVGGGLSWFGAEQKKIMSTTTNGHFYNWGSVNRWDMGMDTGDHPLGDENTNSLLYSCMYFIPPLSIFV